jgi:transposase
VALAANVGAMERAEAEAVYGQGRETVVAVVVELSAQNALLRERVARLSERVAKQDERIAELERRLNRNSRNSSTPPSQDPPGAPERRRKGPSGRGQGGQPGHPGRGRGLLPAEAVDLVVERWPERCGCGHRFAEAGREPLGDPARHQLSELPEIAVRVTEYRLHRQRCPDCGATARAEPPAGLGAGAFGPRLEAAVATLSVRNRVSRRDTVELIGELFGARVSAGAVDAIVGRAGVALDRPYEDLLDQVRSAPAVNIDETGWRLKGQRRTLWGVLTPRAAIFRVAPDRHEREAIALLGKDFDGVVGSDRWWAYRGFDPAQRQLCWSHLIRDFTAHAEGLAAQKEFGERGLEIARGVFRAWDEFQEHGDHRRLKRQVAPLKRELKALLRRGSKGKRHKRTRGFSKNLLKVWPALWTFTTATGVEPTNNAAERGLRGAVIYRKLSLGSQSEHGERRIERLLSASQTCRLQRRSLFAYLTEALGAKVRGDPVPLLV